MTRTVTVLLYYTYIITRKPSNHFEPYRCTCFEGWGADTDLTLYRAADCSARVCPAGKAWGDVPSGSLTAHVEQECSSRYTTKVYLEGLELVVP